jgi:hypothetical protein
MRFLFICGCGHSGTSLMLGIFANSANVAVTRDETFALSKLSVQQFKDSVKKQVSDKTLFVEKTPRHIHYLEKICADTESEALVLVRNPLDVVASLKKRGFSVEQSISRYINDNLAWQRYANHPKVKVIRYEDLVDSSKNILANLTQRYGVDLESGDLKRQEDSRIYFKGQGATRIEKTDGKGEAAHLALRNYQIRQKLENMNGEWKNRLTQDESQMVMEWCAPALHKFYADMDLAAAA